MTWKLKVLKTNHILIVLLLLFSNCGGNNGDRAGVTEVGNPNVKTSINGVVYNYSKKGNIKPVGGAVVINQSGDTIGISDANGNYAGSLLKSNNEDFLKVMINGYIFQTAKINKNNDTIVCNFKLQETDNNPATLNSGGLHYSSKNNTSPKLASSGAQATIVSGDGLIQLTVQNGWSVNGLEAAILATAYNEIANINNLPSFRNKFILDRNKNPDIVCGGQIEIKKKINDCYAEGRLKNSDINWNGNVDLICAKSLSKNLCDWKNYFNDSKKKLYLYFLDDNGNWQYKSTARIIDIGGVLYCAPDTSCFLNGFYDFLFATEQSFNITISGYVKDKFTNLPIPNVEVIIPELAVPVLTDNSGRYSIEASMPFRSGSLTLHFIKSGYTYQNSAIEIDLSNDILDYSLNQYLSPANVGANIAGIVSDSSTNQPVQNSRIVIETKTVFDFAGYNENRKYLYVNWMPNVNYSFYYKNLETNNEAIIKSGVSNGISDTEIIIKLKSDGYKKGSFYIRVIAAHSNFTESDTIAKFDLYLDYIASSSIGGIKTVNIFGGEDRGYFFGKYPDTALISSETWSVSAFWGDSSGAAHLIIPEKLFSGNLLPLSQMKSWINENIDALNLSAPGAGGKTYLEDVCTVKINYQISYGNSETGDTLNFILFNINADSFPKISGMKILQPTNQIAGWSVFSDTAGFYEFKNIPVNYAGRISIFAEKYGFIKSDVYNVNALSAGTPTNINFKLRESYSGSKPGVPQNVYAQISGDSILISWKSVEFADSYFIYYDNFSPTNEPFSNTVIIPSANTKAVISNIDKSLKYYIKIRAFNSSGGFGEYCKMIEL